jgi:hypothetical protein
MKLKKIFIIIISFNIFFYNYVSSATGTGELKLNQDLINYFVNYISNPKGKPSVFLVTEDGQQATSWYCPYAECVPGGAMNEIKLCEVQLGKKCYVFAVGREIKWKNTETLKLGYKERTFSSKDTYFEVKEKFEQFGFLSLKINNTKKQNIDVNSSSSGNISKELEELNDLFKSGALSKEEFEIAKKKVLY